jgi:hypothetical protein
MVLIRITITTMSLPDKIVGVYLYFTDALRDLGNQGWKRIEDEKEVVYSKEIGGHTFEARPFELTERLQDFENVILIAHNDQLERSKRPGVVMRLRAFLFYIELLFHQPSSRDSLLLENPRFSTQAAFLHGKLPFPDPFPQLEKVTLKLLFQSYFSSSCFNCSLKAVGFLLLHTSLQH